MSHSMASSSAEELGEGASRLEGEGAEGGGRQEEGEFPRSFSSPVRSYDVHVYFFHTDAESTEVARQVREEVMRVFPELTVYRLWDRPVGPHPVGMFEVDLKTPAHLARFLPWLQLHNRGLSALIHPNTGFPLLDHTRNALWLGRKHVLNTACLQDSSHTYGL